MMTSIVENLQLNIKDIARYEDGLRYPGENSLAFGLFIDSLTVEICATSWIPESTSWNATEVSLKLIELDGPSVYWSQINQEQMFHILDLADLAVTTYSILP